MEITQAIDAFGLAVGSSVSALIFSGYAICAIWGVRLLLRVMKLKRKQQQRKG